jgi:hypothetical protein
MGRITSHNTSDARYHTLRIIGSIWTVIGGVLLIIGAVLLALGIHAILTGTASEPAQGVDPFTARPVIVIPLINSLGGALSVMWAVACLVSGLQFLAMGALCRVAIHVEENTRVTAQCLESFRARLDSSEETGRPIFRS